MSIVASQYYHLGPYGKATVYVLWDIENCDVPRDCDPTTIAMTIKSSLRNLGYKGSIKIVAVVANEHRLRPNIREMLKNNHVKLYVLESQEKQVSDEYIKTLINKWVVNHPSPANIMLISGDGGFAPILYSLVTRRYNVMLAYNTGSVSNKLRCIGTTHWEWRDLLQL